MEKRHKHVSPTLDIMAKKIFSLPEVTVAFIRDILDLDVGKRRSFKSSTENFIRTTATFM